MTTPLDAHASTGEKPTGPKSQDTGPATPLAKERAPVYESGKKLRFSSGQPLGGGLFNCLNISIFDKIGRPSRFKWPVQVSPDRIAAELSALRRLLLENRIQLMVSSPHISDAVLFRFMTGEFMDIKISDDGSPLFHCFLYDDYHPDPFFANEQTALNRCIRLLLDRALPCTPDIFQEMVTLNRYGRQKRADVLAHIAHFKQRYDEIVSLEINSCRTEIHGQSCEVTGAHATGFIRGNRCLLRAGRWQVIFSLNDYAEWKIAEVHIEDVDI
jgi:hypothetical protein